MKSTTDKINTGVLLGEEEVGRLNEAARQFAAGINFSMRTDNLPPLQIDSTLDGSLPVVDSSTSTSNESTYSTNQADFKSEALRLRVKVTNLEEELQTAREALAKNVNPSKKMFQQHVARITHTHHLEIELMRRQLESEREKNKLLLQTAESKTVETLSLLDHERIKNDKNESEILLIRKQLINEQEKYRQQIIKLQEENDSQKKAARDATSKVLLLEQQLKFLSKDRRERQQEREESHKMELAKLNEQYTKQLRNLHLTHQQLQNQYAAELQSTEINPSVTVRFVSAGTTTTTTESDSDSDASIKKSASELAAINASSDSSDLFTKNNEQKSGETKFSGDSYGDAITSLDSDLNDCNQLDGWDGIRIALSLAKVSHQKLTRAKLLAEKHVSEMMRQSAITNNEQKVKVQAMDEALQTMLRSLHDRAKVCALAVNKIFKQQKVSLQYQEIEEQTLWSHLRSSKLDDFVPENLNNGCKQKDADESKTSRKSHESVADGKETKTGSYATAIQSTSSNQKNLLTLLKQNGGSDTMIDAQDIADILEQCQKSIEYAAVNVELIQSFNNGVLDTLFKLFGEFLQHAKYFENGACESKSPDGNDSDNGNDPLKRHALMSADVFTRIVRLHHHFSCSKSTIDDLKKRCTELHTVDTKIRTDAAARIRKLVVAVDLEREALIAAKNQTKTLEVTISEQKEAIEKLEKKCDEQVQLAAKAQDDHCCAILAEQKSSQTRINEIEAEAEARQLTVIRLHRTEANEVIAEANLKLTALSREHAEAAGTAIADMSTLNKRLQQAQQKLQEAKIEAKEINAERGDLRNLLQKYENENQQLCEAKKHSSATTQNLRSKLKALTSSHAQVHHDWCASEAALANIEAQRVKLRQQLKQERAARAAAHRAALNGSAEQLSMREMHEAKLIALQSQCQNEHEASLCRLKHQQATSLQEVKATAALKNAELRNEVNIAEAAFEAAQKQWKDEMAENNAVLTALKLEHSAAATFRDGEINALRETLARSDAAQVAATTAARRDAQSIALATEKSHAAEIKRFKKKIHDQKLALHQARAMVQKVHGEVQRLHRERATMGVERWSTSTSESSGNSKEPSFNWTTIQSVTEDDENCGTNEDVLEAKQPTADAAGHVSDECAEDNGGMTTIIGASFYGSGINIGLRSGDEQESSQHSNTSASTNLSQNENMPGGTSDSNSNLDSVESTSKNASNIREVNSINQYNSASTSSIVEVSRILSHVGGSVDPDIFDAEPWAE